MPGYRQIRFEDEGEPMPTAAGLVCTEPGHLEIREIQLPEPGAGDALVRVAGCGLCHTDVGFYTGAVRTRHALPLVFGHEISGTVETAPPEFDHLCGRPVLIPAVMPCGRCDLCRGGRENACASQLMPGNDIDGGFATHVIVPAAQLVPIDDPGSLHLHELSVVADAVTTPYQALKRACVNADDLVIIIGIGGIGTYAVQIASVMGALVAAIDLSADRRTAAAALGAGWTFDPAAIDGRGIKKQLFRESGVSTARWRVFEMSGTARGQELAWSLLPPAGTLGVIGFTMDKPDIRLSNLMALDATAFGSWGCSPRLYPEAIALVTSGAVSVRPFIESHPLADGPALFDAAARHLGSGRRPVLIPPEVSCS
jgi:6-hydroxycyclohex-1-ene-1-carbonyl-CoA dehydrogenase